MNPRQEANDRLGGGYDARVLEPSPPAATEAPYFADDPVAREPATTGLAVVSPVTTGDLTWATRTRTDPALAEWCADRWLGACRRLGPIPDLDAFTQTRHAWHTLAEHVVAPARYAANGKIGLRFTRGGFGTPWFAAAGLAAELRVEGADIVRDDGAAVLRERAETLAHAATFAGVEPGAPAAVYTATTPLDLHAPLGVDPTAAAFLGDWFGFGASVLEQLRAEAAADDDPGRVQLWPEHFDLSVDLGDESTGARGTFGASPGDAAHPEPYLYITHWSEVPPRPFWNDHSFAGASLPFADLLDAADQRTAALAFFRSGRRVLTSPSP